MANENDSKTFSLGTWGSFTVGGLAAAVLTAVLTQYTECSPSEPGPVDPVVDAGEPVEPDADVIDAAIPEEDAEVPVETDAGEPASF